MILLRRFAFERLRAALDLHLLVAKHLAHAGLGPA